jgi:uncharacterized protein (TIGR02246 family)
MKNLALVVAAALVLGANARGATADDEKAIRALSETFAQGMVKKDSKLRASLWLEDGTLVPPNARFLSGRDAIEKYFQLEVQFITENSKATFSDYRFRFVKPDVAFVDTELTLNNIIGPNGKLLDEVRVSVALTAVRRGGKWFIQDERHILNLWRRQNEQSHAMNQADCRLTEAMPEGGCKNSVKSARPG